MLHILYAIFGESSHHNRDARLQVINVTKWLLSHRNVVPLPCSDFGSWTPCWRRGLDRSKTYLKSNYSVSNQDWGYRKEKKIWSWSWLGLALRLSGLSTRIRPLPDSVLTWTLTPQLLVLSWTSFRWTRLQHFGLPVILVNWDTTTVSMWC